MDSRIPVGYQAGQALGLFFNDIPMVYFAYIWLIFMVNAFEYTM